MTASLMRERTVSKALRDGVTVPTVACASVRPDCGMNVRGLKVEAVETSYLKGGCGVKRMDGEKNECVYTERFGVSSV